MTIDAFKIAVALYCIALACGTVGVGLRLLALCATWR
jgi:hypothetical protein